MAIDACSGSWPSPLKGDLGTLRSSRSISATSGCSARACSMPATRSACATGRRSPGFVFFTAMAVRRRSSPRFPLLGSRSRAGAVQWPTPKGWAVLAYRGARPFAARADLLHARRRADRPGPRRPLRQPRPGLRRAAGGPAPRRALRPLSRRRGSRWCSAASGWPSGRASADTVERPSAGSILQDLAGSVP